MNRDILALIHENMDTFSKGQKRIANYILESYDKAAFMTASKLGKRVNVSESTVVPWFVLPPSWDMTAIPACSGPCKK